MKQIHNWEELAELEPSTTHYLEIDLELGCGRIRNFYGQYESYLSTHTFYGYGVMEYISEKLQSCGFDVEIIGWDKEPKKKLVLDWGYRTTEEQIRLVNERFNNFDYNSPHKFNWHEYARECGISNRDRYNKMIVRRKK